MKITRIELTNFRQFHGEQVLDMAVSPEKNVTLIHAENTYGKTTILNAVLWAMFEQLTSKFEQPDKIVNFEACTEGVTQAKATVQFAFNDKKYAVTRVFHLDRGARNQSDLYAYLIKDGNFSPVQSPETFVSTVVPPEMAKYFFFDGEAAEAFSSATNHRAISAAIRSILGCSLADTAIADLQDLKKGVDSEIGEVCDDQKIKDIEANIARVSKDIETHAILELRIRDDIATFHQQLTEITDSLRQLEGAKEIQALRDEKELQLRRVTQEIGDQQRQVVEWIASSALSVVSGRLSKETLEFIDTESLRGRIPSPYNEDFVKGLLQEEICVCRRCLAPGSPEWEAVAGLLKNASSAESMGRVIRARSRIQLLARAKSEAPERLKKIQSSLAARTEQRSKLEQEVAELGKKIENLPLEEIAQRERARRSLQVRIDEENQNLGGVRRRIHEMETEKREYEAALEENTLRNQQAKGLMARRRLLTQAAEGLKVLLAGYEKVARAEIEREINAILEVVAHNHRICRFGEDFSIELTRADGVPAPKSSGESQLLSLVFIATLVKFAASRIDSTDILLKPGTVAPLVLDSPFGQLDPIYQEEMARCIPKLAPQVVLLVSGSQGNEKVLAALEPHVGAEYVLITENKEPQGQKRQSILRRNGKEIITALYSQPRSMTRIERIL